MAKTAQRLRTETLKLFREMTLHDAVPRIFKTQIERLHQEWLRVDFSDHDQAQEPTQLRQPKRPQDD